MFRFRFSVLLFLLTTAVTHAAQSPAVLEGPNREYFDKRLSAAPSVKRGRRPFCN